MKIPIRSYKKRTGIFVRSHSRSVNVNIPLGRNTNAYFGLNSSVGPYAGIKSEPLQNLEINPRINARYGPSANAKYKVSEDINLSASVTPTNADANIQAKVSKNTSIGLGCDRLGVYGQIQRKKREFRMRLNSLKR